MMIRLQGGAICRHVGRFHQALSASPAASYGRQLFTSTKSLGPHNRELDCLPFSDTRMVQEYAKDPIIERLTIGQLYRYGKSVDEKKLIKSAQHLQQSLPARLARQIERYQQLPFVVGCNPHFHQVYKTYAEAFQKFSRYPEIRSGSDEKEFVVRLKELLDEHQNAVNLLSAGCQTSPTVVSRRVLNQMVDNFLLTRIGIRLLIEQQVNLHNPRKGFSGIIQENMVPQKVVQRCADIADELCYGQYGRAPEVIYNGCLEETVCFIPAHLEYIMQELLKNSFRATIEAHQNSDVLPTVNVTIAVCEDEFVIRVSDEGGGIQRRAENRIFDYSYTTVGQDLFQNNSNSMLGDMMDTGTGVLAGLGFGLPMARCYAKYFGGKLELISLFGHGTDVFVRLKRLNTSDAMLQTIR